MFGGLPPVNNAEPSLLQRARIFSRYGYAPEPKWSVLQLFADDVFAEQKRELAARPHAELLKLANHVADAVFAETFADLQGQIAIPISGGRDSRMILAMAVEAGLGARVTTLTWGVEGGLDVVLGRKVARHFGVRHDVIDVLAQPIGFEHLRNAYLADGRWTDLVHAHFNQMWRQIAPGATGIVGYLGGPPVGCHYTRGAEHLSFAEAVAAFEQVNRRFSGGAAMFGDVRDKLIGADRVSLPEQLDLVFRQEGYLRRLVASHAADVRTPFAHPTWLRFMYALPPSLREDSRFFSSYLHRRFPRAMRIGVAKGYGASANAAIWQRKVARQFVKLANVSANFLRSRGFRTFDKYGDPRDLALLLEQADAPRAYQRLIDQRPQRPSISQAVAWRQRAMLIVNLACAIAEHEEQDYVWRKGSAG